MNIANLGRGSFSGLRLARAGPDRKNRSIVIVSDNEYAKWMARRGGGVLEGAYPLTILLVALPGCVPFYLIGLASFFPLPYAGPFDFHLPIIPTNCPAIFK